MSQDIVEGRTQFLWVRPSVCCSAGVPAAADRIAAYLATTQKSSTPGDQK